MRARIVLGAILVALLLSVAFGGALPAAAQGEVQGGAQAGNVIWHTVRPGDTVNGLARYYGVSPTAIIQANNLRPPYTIYVGQALVIPRWQYGPIYHTVVRGEYVSLIARRYGVSTQALLEANGLRPPYVIRPGQVLLIPVGGPVPPPVRLHTVRPGDTLIGLGLAYGVPWGDIAVANGLQYPFYLYVGQVLRIPQGGVTPPPAPRITIHSPASGATVTSPVRVSGWGRASFEQNLVVRVLDRNGALVGQTPVIVQSEIGQPGPFTVDVPFVIPVGTQPGRIEVVDYSPKDGSVVASASVGVTLRR